jgi:hypothetical protein
MIMKSVLLPADLSVQSLSPVHNVVRDAKNEKVVINVVHVLSLPTSITDLLFIAENKPYNKVPDNFIEAFEMLRNKYKRVIEKISFDFVYCSNSRYLNNFIEGNGIEAIYMLDNYSYKQPLQQSQKFTAFIEKCKVPLIKCPLPAEVLSEYQTLSSLLSGSNRQPVDSASPAKAAIIYS